MTLADVGKNGDQINLLASELADILVVQHCHAITNPVRGMLRAFAQQFGNLRVYCVIDGYETLRVLEHNRLCNLSPRDVPLRPAVMEEPEWDGDEGSPEDYENEN